MKPYYQDEYAALYCGDNAIVLPTIDSDSIDLTVTSPPYDNLRTYNGYSWDFEKVARELYRVTKRGGVVVWVVGDQTIDGSETGTSFRQALYFKDVAGFNLHDTMIYEAAKMVLNHNRYEQVFEYMFVFSKGSPKTFNPIKIKTNKAGLSVRCDYGKPTKSALERVDAKRWRDDTYVVADEKIKGNIWRYPVGLNGTTKDAFAFGHPAIFPEALASDHIRSWSNPGDLILDPFMGSNTTGKMAIKNGCRFIGIEISEEYCEIAAKRLRQGVLSFAPEVQAL